MKNKNTLKIVSKSISCFCRSALCSLSVTSCDPQQVFLLQISSGNVNFHKVQQLHFRDFGLLIHILNIRMGVIMSSISQVYFTKKSFPKPYYSQEQSSMDYSLKNYDLTLPSSTFPHNMLTVHLPLLVSPSVLFCLCSVFITFSIFPLSRPTLISVSISFSSFPVLPSFLFFSLSPPLYLFQKNLTTGFMPTIASIY